MDRKHSFALLCIVRKDRLNKQQKYPVYLRISVDTRRVEIATKVTIATDKWDVTIGRLKGNTEDAKKFNRLLENIEFRAREIYNQFMLEGKIISAESIKNELTGIEYKKRLLHSTFNDWVDMMEKKENKGYSPGTVKNWKVTRGHLKEFIANKYKTDDIPFKELNLSLFMTLNGVQG